MLQVEELGAAAALCGCLGRLCGPGTLLHHPYHSRARPHQCETPYSHLAKPSVRQELVAANLSSWTALSEKFTILMSHLCEKPCM